MFLILDRDIVRIQLELSRETVGVLALAGIVIAPSALHYGAVDPCCLSDRPGRGWRTATAVGRGEAMSSPAAIWNYVHPAQDPVLLSPPGDGPPSEEGGRGQKHERQMLGEHAHAMSAGRDGVQQFLPGRR